MPEKAKYVYKNWDSLKKDMDLIVHTINKLDPEDRSLVEHGAYVTRKGNSKNSYSIYISPYAAGRASLMHEYGHIKFQHLKYEELLIKQVEEKFKAAWPKIQKYIKWDSASFDIKDVTFRNFLHIVQNHAMDMEVNSKLFEMDERRRVDFESTKEMFNTLKHFAEKDKNNRTLKKLNDFLVKHKEDKNHMLVTLIWPERFGFPQKLFWHQYIDLILANPEKLLKDLAKELNEKKAFIEIMNPGKRVADAIDKNPLKGNEIMSSEDIQNLADSLDSQGDPAKMDGSGDGGEESRFQSTDKNTNINNASVRNQMAEKFKVEPLGPAVEKFIQKYTIDEYKEFKTDFLYNYNRGKTGGVLRSKTVENPEYYTGNCYVIVDTSGSIGSTQLNQIVAFFKKIKNRVGSKSKVIWFDTDLQRIDKLSAIKDAPRGGSNDMGKAIDFVNKWTTKEDICFIISDFYDYADRMIKAINKFRGRFYGIKWSSDEEAKMLKKAAKEEKNVWYYKEIFDICKACDDFILVDCKAEK